MSRNNIEFSEYFRLIRQNVNSDTRSTMLDTSSLITKRESVQNETQFLRSLIDNTPDGIFIVDSETGRFLHVNQRACNYTGYTCDELLTMGVWDLDESWCPERVAEVWKKQNRGDTLTFEAIVKRKDGTVFPVEISVCLIDYSGRRLLLASVRDITERKKMEEGLRKAHAELELKVKERTADISNANKKLRQQITERKHVEKALRESLRKLSRKNRYECIISTITRSVHQSINLQQVLENSVEALKQNIDNLDSASIFIVEGQDAVVKVHRGFPKWIVRRLTRIPYPRGATWKTILEEKPIYCMDTDQDTVIGPAGKELGIKSYLITPIFYEGRTVGTLNINSLSKNAFNNEELQLLEIIAQQINIAIRNAKQAEALQKALVEVELLKNRLQEENKYLQEEIQVEHNFEEIIGQSKSIVNVLCNVKKLAPTDTTILIQGETGTGKELIARAIHNLSLRKEHPLVKVNCAALPAQLVESELFGHEKGAFTGAVNHRVGRFELADCGTIFLDEVAELPPNIQVKLLRVLQEGEFERVGNSKPIKVNARIIAATNCNLRDAVQAGSFRPDLFYRLNVFPIEVPPLRERKSDIPILAHFFVSKFAKKFCKEIDGISKDTMNQLVSYPWPGNVRELQNVIERATVLSNRSIIRIDESMLSCTDDLLCSNSRRLEDIERSHILRVLDETNWVINGKYGAAAVLGLNPSTLRFRMRKLDIKRSAKIRS